ncbi:hypothetical protein GCM10009625_06850 [Brachybacterium fresconis]
MGSTVSTSTAGVSSGEAAEGSVDVRRWRDVLVVAAGSDAAGSGVTDSDAAGSGVTASDAAGSVAGALDARLVDFVDRGALEAVVPGFVEAFFAVLFEVEDRLAVEPVADPDPLRVVDAVFVPEVDRLVDPDFFAGDDPAVDRFAEVRDVVEGRSSATSSPSVSGEAEEALRADPARLRRWAAARAMSPARSGRWARSRWGRSPSREALSPEKNMSTGRSLGAASSSGDSGRTRVRSSCSGAGLDPAPGIRAPSPRPSPRFCVMAVVLPESVIHQGRNQEHARRRCGGAPGGGQGAGRVVSSWAAAR